MSWRGGHQTIYAISNILVREKDEAAKPDIACLYYGDLENETPEQFVLRQEEATLLQRAIDRLDARHARVIRLRMAGLQFDQIGDQFGVTKERIRQMEAKARRKLLWFLKKDFKDRFNSLAKVHNWWWELDQKKQAEDRARDAEFAARRAEREKQQAIEWEARQEAARLEVKRMREQNAFPRPRRYTVRTGLYIPRMIDPQTGAWEWVEVVEEVDDASAA